MIKNTVGLAERMREVVFGAEDGLVSTLGVVTGVAAGSKNSFIVVLTGLVVIAVEAISMAAGSYLSSGAAKGVEEKSVNDAFEKARRNIKAAENALKEIYALEGLEKGMAEKLAAAVVKNPKLLRREVALHELGVGDSEGQISPAMNAVLMGSSYVIAGMIVIAPYFFLPLFESAIVSIAASITALFFVGVVKSRYTLGLWWKDGLQMVLVSAGAAALGYIVGELVAVNTGIRV